MLARLVQDLAKVMTIKDISDFLNMTWHKVRDITQEALETKEKSRTWRQVKVIAIDEIAIRKGHRYLTVIVDLESGMVLDAVEGRHGELLKACLQSSEKSRCSD